MTELKRAKVEGYIKVPVDMIVMVEVNENSDKHQIWRDAVSAASELFDSECGGVWHCDERFESDIDGDEIGDEWSGKVYTEVGKVHDGNSCELDLSFTGFVGEDADV